MSTDENNKKEDEKTAAKQVASTAEQVASSVIASVGRKQSSKEPLLFALRKKEALLEALMKKEANLLSQKVRALSEYPEGTAPENKSPGP